MRFVPPSPNWFTSKVGDLDNKGRYAFATRNSVCIMDINSCELVGFLRGHLDRVNVVQFTPQQNHNTTCLTASTDSTVRVWDVETLTVLYSHSHHTVFLFYSLISLNISPKKKNL